MPSEGGIALDYFIPPALNAKVLLDGTNSPRDPWYRNPTFSTTRAGKRAADFGDHPGMVVRLGLQNRVRSNVRNFLFHCFMKRGFFTILGARAGRAAEPSRISNGRCATSSASSGARPAVVINQSSFTC
jgi:hypothetical protein